MQKRYIFLIIFLLISALIFIFQDSSPVKILGSSVQSVFSAPKIAIYAVRTKAFGGGKGKQISNLKSENARLTKKLADYEKLKEDNEALRSQFENSQSHNFKLLPSHVIGLLGNAQHPSALIIDAGQKSVKSGMAVISGSNLVGKISEVSDNYSKVLLPQNPQFSTVAKTAENQSLGIIRGERDFILLSEVSIKDKIDQGETVLTRGEAGENGSFIPKDLIIGRIVSVYKNESSPQQTAKVISEVDIARLETLFVVVGF